jgi:hypothetical protein
MNWEKSDQRVSAKCAPGSRRIRTRRYRLNAVTGRYLALALFAGVTSSSQQPLDDSAIKAAITLGNRCGEVPLIKLSETGHDFDVYVESPFARVAIYAAAARQMNAPFERKNVTADIGGLEYHLWLQYTLHASRTLTVRRLLLQPARSHNRRVIEPIGERPFQLAARTRPAHGIVTEVRWRQYEWLFDHIPNDDFDVIVHTTAGTERFRVADRHRHMKMRVCT